MEEEGKCRLNGGGYKLLQLISQELQVGHAQAPILGFMRGFDAELLPAQVAAPP